MQLWEGGADAIAASDDPMIQFVRAWDDDARTIRTRYIELFGAVTRDDPLYEAVSAGQRFPGLEHWLPLFHDNLDTLLDYLPGASLVLDHLTDDAVKDRLEQITEHYEARIDGLASRAAIAPPGNRRPAEVQRAPGLVEHDLHDVRIVQLGLVAQGMRRGAHHAIGCAGQRLGTGIDQAGVEQGLVALDIDDDGLVGQAEQAAGLGQAVAAGAVVLASEDAAHRVGLAGRGNARVVTGHHHLGRAARGVSATQQSVAPV